MSTLAEPTDKSRRTLRLAVIAAALGVAGMFTAAATVAGSEVQASEASSVVSSEE